MSDDIEELRAQLAAAKIVIGAKQIEIEALRAKLAKIEGPLNLLDTIELMRHNASVALLLYQSGYNSWAEERLVDVLECSKGARTRVRRY